MSQGNVKQEKTVVPPVGMLARKLLLSLSVFNRNEFGI